MRDMPAGRPKELTEEDVITIIKSSDDPFVWPAEIAQEAGVSTVTARKALNRMKETELVECKRSGSGSGWWIER